MSASRDGKRHPEEPSAPGEPDEAAEGLEELLLFVRDARGFDFTGYKRSTIERRVRRRMLDVKLDSIGEYQGLLEADVDEFTALFNTILINLTGFFRDPCRLDSTSSPRSSPRSLRAGTGTSPSASGARAAPPARSRTRSPWPWPTAWAFPRRRGA